MESHENNVRNMRGAVVVTRGKRTTAAREMRKYIQGELEYGSLVKVEYCWATIGGYILTVGDLPETYLKDIQVDQ